MAVKVTPKKTGQSVASGNSTGGKPRLRVVQGGASKPVAPKAPFAGTDDGNAKRLAYYFGSKIRYVPAWRTFLVWTGTHWFQDLDGVKVQGLAKEVAHRIKTVEAEAEQRYAYKEALLTWHKASQARARIEAMIALVKSEPGITVDHRGFDKEPSLLNVQNGTVDLKTGKLRVHDPMDLITKIIPFEYDASAKAGRWDRFLDEVVEDKSTRDFLHTFAGYCATADVSERMLVILYGGGRNGKSVFLRALKTALGEYACAAMPNLLMRRKMEPHPTEVADLFGKRLAIASEVQKGSTFDESQIKRLTGNDPLKARRMQEDPWEFDPTFKLLLAANHKPAVRDASESIWDRFALVPFAVRVTRVDRKLGEKLKREMSGILGWIVRGAVRWYGGGLALPEGVRQATGKYREEQDMVGRYFTDCTTLNKQYFTPSARLVASAVRWCADQGAYPIQRQDLEERLVELGCVRIRTARANGWRGIGLNLHAKNDGLRRKKR